MAPSGSDTRRPRRLLGLDGAQRQQERRRLLLEAAVELFGTRGYGQTSIELLCQTAGVGTNSFYEIFTSKEDAFVALYDGLTGTLRDAVTAAYLDHRGDEDPIRPLVSAFVHGAVDDPRVAQVAFIESAGVSPTVEEHRRRTRNEFVDGLRAIGTDLREAASGAGERQIVGRPGPRPRRNAVAVVGAIIEMTVDWLNDDQPDAVESLIDDISFHCHRVIDAIIDSTAERTAITADAP